MAEATATAPAKKKINVFGIIAIIVALLIATLVTIKLVKQWRNKKKLQAESGNKTTEKETLKDTIRKKMTEKDSAGFPLGEGDKGDNVKLLQGYLNKISNYEFPYKFDPLKEDGSLGKLTRARVETVIGKSYFPVTKEIFNKIADRAKNTGYQTTPN